MTTLCRELKQHWAGIVGHSKTIATASGEKRKRLASSSMCLSRACLVKLSFYMLKTLKSRRVFSLLSFPRDG
jgi:hypothetical protein